MPEITVHSPDHDLLIQLNTKLDQVVLSLSVITELEKRIRDVENKDARHSETMQALRRDVDALKVAQIQSARIDALEEDMTDLKKKSNFWDGLNSLGIVIGTIFTLWKR